MSKDDLRDVFWCTKSVLKSPHNIVMLLLFNSSTASKTLFTLSMYELMLWFVDGSKAHTTDRSTQWFRDIVTAITSD